MTPAGLLTQAEAAERLGLSPNTLEKWRLTRRHRLKFVKLGGAVRYRAVDIDSFIEDCVVGNTPRPRSRRRSISK